MVVTILGVVVRRVVVVVGRVVVVVRRVVYKNLIRIVINYTHQIQFQHINQSNTHTRTVVVGRVVVRLVVVVGGRYSCAGVVLRVVVVRRVVCLKQIKASQLVG